MKKVLFILIAILLLAACGGTSQSVDVKDTKNESEEKTEEASSAEESEHVGSDDEELLAEGQEKLIDTDKYTIDLEKVEKKSDAFSDEIVATFKIENKTDETLEFYSQDVSADGEMVPETNTNMFQTVKAGKSATAKFYIETFDEEYELPGLEEDLTIDIMVTDEDFDFEGPHEIVIDF